jgi:hypothetical protein
MYTIGSVEGAQQKGFMTVKITARSEYRYEYNIVRISFVLPFI